MSKSKGYPEDDLDFIDDDFWTDELEEQLEKVDAKRVSGPEVNCDEHTRLSFLKDGHECDNGGTADDVLQATGISVDQLSSCLDEDFEDGVVGPGDDSNHSIGEESISRKRKFPGPAGMLPKSGGVTLWEMRKSSEEAKKATRKSITSEDIPCTPWPSENDSLESPWGQMLKDFDGEQGRDILEYNVAWVLKMKKLKQLPHGKVPVLCVTLKAVDKDMLTFRDRTGEIMASVDKSVAELRDHLKPGAALVLRKTSVYRDPRGRYCLNVTRDNLVDIYTCGEDAVFDGKVVVNSSSAMDLLALSKRMLREASEQLTLAGQSPQFRCLEGEKPLPRMHRGENFDDVKHRTSSPSVSRTLKNFDLLGVREGVAGNGSISPLISPIRVPTYKMPKRVTQHDKVSKQTRSLARSAYDGGRGKNHGRESPMLSLTLKPPHQERIPVEPCNREQKSIFQNPPASTKAVMNVDEEELGWLDDEVDDIFRTIGEDCLS